MTKRVCSANAEGISPAFASSDLLALRQKHDIAPPGESSLLLDAGAVGILQFYFLQTRTPLSAAQLAHLTSSERLVFGSVPLPPVAKKRPSTRFPLN